MIIYHLTINDSERTSKTIGFFDSHEAVLEYCKNNDLHDWFDPVSVYEHIKRSELEGKSDWHITIHNVITLDDVKYPDTSNIGFDECNKLLEKYKNNKNSTFYKAYKKRLLYLVKNDMLN